MSDVKNDIEIVGWDFLNDNNIIRTSKEEVLNQVISGLISKSKNIGSDLLCTV